MRATTITSCMRLACQGAPAGPQAAGLLPWPPAAAAVWPHPRRQAYSVLLQRVLDWFPLPWLSHLRVPCFVQPRDFLLLAITTRAPLPMVGAGRTLLKEPAHQEPAKATGRVI